ncbi:DUF3821 domain-containing protein [Methanosphaerula subterraneus]|uniref:DUF3821 domain-containing protein n=1 Tax=Methanosphaerula subterraneus TaxID=3350244 RepID=UPI003F82CC61
MNHRHSLVCLIAGLILCMMLIGAAGAGTPVKIMPLGDSLTQGSDLTPDQASHPTYRYWLWNGLVSGGYQIDFVGSTRSNFTYQFDQDHEGHAGYTTAMILNGNSSDPASGNLTTWLSSYSPDIVMISLGIQDQIAGVPLNQTQQNVAQIIDILRYRNPAVKVLVGTVPPSTVYRQNVQTINDGLAAVAAARNTTASPVTMVDLTTGYDGVTDNQAGSILPNETGERKIAQRWYGALVPLVSSSTPVNTTVAPGDTLAAGTNASGNPAVIPFAGATVYAGEQNLNISATGVAAGTTLGWFKPGVRPSNITPDDALVVDNPSSFTVPAGTKNGLWYDMTRMVPAFTVRDPSVGVRIIDLQRNVDITGQTINTSTPIGFILDTNFEAFTQRSAAAPVTIRVQNPAGQIYRGLIDDRGQVNWLNNISVSTNPLSVKGTGSYGSLWNTGDLNYTAGLYHVWAETNVNNIKESYQLSDGSYSLGTAVSVPVTLTIGTGLNLTNGTPAAGNISGTILPNKTLVNGSVTLAAGNNTTAQNNTSSGPLYLTYTIVAIAVILLIVGLTRPRKPGRRRGGNNRDL